MAPGGGSALRQLLPLTQRPAQPASRGRLFDGRERVAQWVGGGWQDLGLRGYGQKKSPPKAGF